MAAKDFVSSIKFWMRLAAMLAGAWSAISVIQRFFGIGLVPVLAELLEFYRELIYPIFRFFRLDLPDWYKDAVIVSNIFVIVSIRAIVERTGFSVSVVQNELQVQFEQARRKVVRKRKSLWGLLVYYSELVAEVVLGIGFSIIFLFAALGLWAVLSFGLLGPLSIWVSLFFSFQKLIVLKEPYQHLEEQFGLAPLDDEEIVTSRKRTLAANAELIEIEHQFVKTIFYSTGMLLVAVVVFFGLNAGVK